MLNIIDCRPITPVPGPGPRHIYVFEKIFPIESLNKDVWHSFLLQYLDWQEILG